MDVIPPSGTVLKGIDLYHGDEISSFAGYDFVFLKATQGVDYIDPAFASRWSALQQAKVIRGAYHFFDPTLEGAPQAEWFAKSLATLESTDLPPVLDIEVIGTVETSVLQSRVLEFIHTLKLLVKRNPIIYGSPYFLQDDLGAAQIPILACMPLWIANYKVEAPMVPKPWLWWDFWQYIDAGDDGAVYDSNYFNGDITALMQLIQRSHI